MAAKESMEEVPREAPWQVAKQREHGWMREFGTSVKFSLLWGWLHNQGICILCVLYFEIFKSVDWTEKKILKEDLALF